MDLRFTCPPNVRLEPRARRQISARGWRDVSKPMLGASLYFSPNALPAAMRRIASFSRRAFVSSCLADSIQPIYRRRCEGASVSKYRNAAGRFLNAVRMYGGSFDGIWNRGGRGP